MFKTILVHLDGASADNAVLETALGIARRFDAHLECVHVVPDAATTSFHQGEIGMETAALVADALEARLDVARKRASNAQSAFKEFCSRNDIPVVESPPGSDRPSAFWRELSGDWSEKVEALARFHDLLVIAGGTREDVIGRNDAGHLVMSCGKPIVLAPPVARSDHLSTVAIAWKNSSEAARAVTAAMPILAKAHRIVVLSANEDASKAMECLECYEHVASQLRWHGFHVEGRYVVPAGRTIPDAVLESARDAGADMLVMGGYSHSRLREFVFGGFTERVLRGTELPVFIFH